MKNVPLKNVASKNISFSSPNISDEDISAVVEVLKSGWITSGGVGEEFSSLLKNYLYADDVFLLNSATAGLFLALKTIGIGEGDEVITTPYTFAATANVIHHVGAKVVFADVKKDSFYMDIDEVYQKITPKTKAIIPVDFSTAHNWDFDFSRLSQNFTPNNHYQEKLNRPLILVDAAHSLGSRFVDENVDMTVYSFHAVKNLTTAEGGALAVGSMLESELTKNIQAYRLHGQSKSAKEKFLSGTWEYDITLPGYKFNMPDTLAAIGLSQFKRYESDTLPYRRKLVKAYQELLKDDRIIMDEEDIFKNVDKSSCHLMPIRVRDCSELERNNIIDFAKSQGVSMNVHFKPLHLMSANKYYDWQSPLPNSEAQYQNQISLPLHNSMSLEDVEYVADVLLKGVKK